VERRNLKRLTVGSKLPIIITNLEKLRVKKMKELKLITFSNNMCTIGKLYHDKELVCHTMELPWLKNAKNISCIPAGSYIVKMTNSPTYGPCYKIQNVTGRTDILIHKGNTTDDTEGCILPVGSYGMLDTFKGKKFAGLASRNSYVKLMSLLGGESFNLTIERY
jgi:hypothetical protein